MDGERAANVVRSTFQSSIGMPVPSASLTTALNEALATQAAIAPHGRAGFLQEDHVLGEHPNDQRDETFAVGDATVDGLASVIAKIS